MDQEKGLGAALRQTCVAVIGFFKSLSLLSFSFSISISTFVFVVWGRRSNLRRIFTGNTRDERVKRAFDFEILLSLLYYVLDRC